MNFPLLPRSDRLSLARGVDSGASRRRLVLLGMANLLLLSGCVLSPLFQAPAAILTTLAVLLGLAACSSGGGGGGGGNDEPPPVQQPPPAEGQPWPAMVSLTLLNQQPTQGLILRGDPAQLERAGSALAIGASVNGDSFGTLVIGAPQATQSIFELGPYVKAGRAYVVFGAANLDSHWSGTTPFSLSTLSGSTGFTVLAAEPLGYAGNAVAVVGDWSGDTRAEVLIGVPYANCGKGEGWLVFGQPNVSTYVGLGLWTGYGGTPLDPSGSEGFMLFNAEAGYNTFLGKTVLGLDLDGDSQADLAAGAPWNGTLGDRVTVVFGSFSGSCGQANVATAGADALMFSGGTDFRTGASLAKGHVTGQHGSGIDDLIIGASPYTGTAGQVYVVFGNSTRGNIVTSAAAFAADGSKGFTVRYSGSNSFSLGRRVAAGDVDGDGIDDVLIGDSTYNPSTVVNAGRVWVVFGTQGAPPWGSDLDLATLATQPELGFSVSLNPFTFVDSLVTAKVNGDGFADLLIGSTDVQQVIKGTTYYCSYTSSDVTPYSTSSNGAVFVVFGSGAPASLSTSQLTGSNGFVALGPDSARIGAALAAGDLTGDGRDDVAVGAPYNTTVGDYGGKVYVVFGVDPLAALPGSSLAVDGFLGGSNNLYGAYCTSGK